MSPVVTDAIVLHAFDYLETSRILRLLTRDAGLVSVLAKGARRSRARYGSAVDLFAEGEAHIYLKPNRDLNTLASFDVTRAHFSVAQTLNGISAASAVAELVLRVGRDDPNPVVYDEVVQTMNRIATAAPEAISGEAIAGTWRIVSAFGFTPVLDHCANCHVPLDPEAPLTFAHSPGGALCSRCAPFVAARRNLPPEAAASVRAWLSGAPAIVTSGPMLRSHLRLLREFLHEHLVGERPLRAFEAWETANAEAV